MRDSQKATYRKIWKNNKMKLQELELKWNKLSEVGLKSGYKAIRIDSTCIPDLFIGRNSDKHRCLVLSLPIGHTVDFQSNTKENLSISFHKESNYIVLLLTESDYHDLFNDLVLSIYNRIRKEKNVDEYSKSFITLYYKWSFFFSDKKEEKLSRDIIKGLFGELLMLKLLIIKSGATEINDILSSWRGPYDQGHDFVLNNKDIEIKTKDDSKSNIRISSEYQLEKEIDKGLELAVISVELNTVKGQAIKELVLEIKNIISCMFGDITILMKALSQKGLTFKNISQYDNFRFIPAEIIIYDCGKKGFPMLIKSNVHPALKKIKYDINTNCLKEFIISKKRY